MDYASLKDLEKAVTVAGNVFNVPNKAESYNTTVRDTLSLVAQRVSLIPEASKVRVYHAVNEAARTDLKGDLCSQITD